MFTLNYLPFLITKYTNLMLIISNYSVVTTISFLLFSSFQLISLNNSNSNANKLSILIIFNLLLTLLKYINIYLIIILIIINFTIFYFYIQFYKNIEIYTQTKVSNNSISSFSLAVVGSFILINFYPIYNLFSLFF